MEGYDVQSKFSIVDSMTPSLLKIVDSMTGVLDTIDMMTVSSKNMFDTSSIKEARASIEEAKLGLLQMKPPIEDLEDGQREYNNEIKDGIGLADGLLGKVKAMVITYGGMRGVSKVFDMSDTLAQSNARLNLVKDATLSIADAQDMVYKSAMRARQPYEQQLDMVSKLQLQAKDAFNSTAETVAFVEQLGKRFKISGTDDQGIESVMFNLTQAMGTGVLRGQDLNAVLANAPSIVQDTAKYMGYTTDKVKELAEDGKLSAQVVKNAMLATANETNEAFAQIPMTFGDIVTMASNAVTRKMEPALVKLNKVFNTDEFQRSIDFVTDLIGYATAGFADLVSVGAHGFSFLADNIGLIVPPLLTVIGLLGVYKGALLISAAAEGVKSFALKVTELGLWSATKAQLGLNAAMYANPVFWVVAGFVALIGTVGLAINMVNKWKGTSVSAIGVVTGMVGVAGASIANIAIGLYNSLQGVGTAIINGVISIAEFIANIFVRPIESIKKLFWDMAIFVYEVLEGIAKGIDAIFGFNLADKVNGWKQSTIELSKKAVSENYITFDRWEAHTIKPFDYNEVWNKSYNWGKEKQDSFKGWTDNLFNPSLYDDMVSAIDSSELAEDVKDGNKKQLEISNAQLEFIRSIAEARSLENLSVGKIEVNLDNKYGDIHNNADMDGFWDGTIEEIEDAISGGVGMVRK